VQGVGYATVKDLLSWRAANMTAWFNGSYPFSPDLPSSTDACNVANSTSSSIGGGGASPISNPTFCLLLFLAKFFSTNITIGSGASGGIFSPSLFIGATLGGLWGHIVSTANDPLAQASDIGTAADFDPIQACVAGMAGLVGGSTGATITAITMTFEMTRDYATILPIIITTVLAHMTRKAISEDSIYTLKLVRRGHVVPEGLQAAVHAAQRVQDVMTTNYRMLAGNDPMTVYDGVTLVIDGRLNLTAGAADADGMASASLACACGPVMLDHLQLFGKTLTAQEYMAASGDGRKKLCVVEPQSDLHDAIRRMSALGAEVLLVSAFADSVHASDVVGVVTKSSVLEEMSKKSTIMSRDRTLHTTRATPLP